MLSDFRQFQFALARHLRDPLTVPAPAGVHPAEANVCNQEMVQHLRHVLEPALPLTQALLGDDVWEHTVRLFLKHAPSHAPWDSTTQRALVDHVYECLEVQNLPGWLKGLVHFEWLEHQGTVLGE
jgi:hypothetical protein